MRPTDPAPSDIRMRGFGRRTTVAAALAWIDARASRLPSEPVSLWQAAGRVLAADVTSRVAVPCFPRSMMDGYAVRASDTQGATPYQPLPLAVVGQSLPGDAFRGSLAPGEAVRIMTGAPLPSGADAVLPAERVQEEQANIASLDEVPPGKNVGLPGEDVAEGTQVLVAGRRLRPHDVALLAAIGHAPVEVVRQPRVRIVVTGNELLPAGQPPRETKIADANGPLLGALVARDGGLPLFGAASREPDAAHSALPHENYLTPDDPAAIAAALQGSADIVLISGGSSVGQEDHAPRLVAELGDLAIHGLAMRPSSPAGMGLVNGQLVFLLPGNPVSCLCAYDFFAGRAIRLLGGRPPAWPYRSARLPLARKLVSQIGRIDYARVRIANGQIEPLAISGASILSSTTRADGFVVIPEESEGHAAGTPVEVFLYDLP